MGNEAATCSPKKTNKKISAPNCAQKAKEQSKLQKNTNKAANEQQLNEAVQNLQKVSNNIYYNLI